MWAAYLGTARDYRDPTPTQVVLRIGGTRVPVRMRHSDLYTLAEVLHERQYRIVDELPREPVIVDAGANIGITALWFLAFRPRARLHCFEPEQENFELLASNLSAFSQVRTVRAAVAEASGQTTLRLAEHPALHALDRPGTAPADDSAELRTVACWSLHDYFVSRRIESVDLLKLDVEGSELGVLEGTGEDLTRVARIVGEVHEQHVAPRAFYERLRASGFDDLRRRRFPSSGSEPVHFFEARRTVS